MKGDQSELPYLGALEQHAASNPGRYNVPAHRGGSRAPWPLVRAIGARALQMDIPPIVHGIDDGPRPTPFELAQRLAADAWGAARTWFLVNGSSQANHVACLAIRRRGRRVLVQRNMHGSTIDGLALSGLEPRFVLPEMDAELGIAHCLRPQVLERALREDPDVAAVIVVSPTYYGMAADVEALVEVAHGFGVPVVVDEAWGAHFAFHDRLPRDALAAGADLVISSTHKMLGSLTQSAMVHLGRDSAFSEDAVDGAVTMLESTSPNALLTASLDAVRQRAALEGKALIEGSLEALRVVRERLVALPGVDVLDDRLVGRMGVAAVDPFRVAIDVRGTGRTGYQLQPLLRERHGVYIELASLTALVAIFSLGDGPRDGDRLVTAVEDALAAAPIAPSRVPRAAPAFGSFAMSPRTAFLSDQERIPLAEATGRVSAESLAVYPPGIPNVIAGELLTDDVVGFLATAREHGGTVRGASDRSLGTIRVVA